MKKFFTLAAALLMSFGMFAEDIVLPLDSVTPSGNNTYTFEGAEKKAKNNNVYIEMPGDNVKGEFTVYGSSNKPERFLYLVVAGQADSERAMAMVPAGATIEFAATDITTYYGRPYLQFSTTDDFKFKKFSFTLDDGKSVLKASADTVELNATIAKPEVSAKVVFTGKNLPDGEYFLTIPNVAGLTVAPASVTVAEDGKLNAEVTLTYAPQASTEAASSEIKLVIGELVSAVALNYSADFTVNYAQSINIEQLVLDNGKAYDIEAALAAANIDFENINELDSLNDEKTARNEPYLGLKFKTAGASFGGWIKAGEFFSVKLGNIADSLKFIQNGIETVWSKDLKEYVSDIYSEDTYVQFVTNSAGTVVLKQFMVNDTLQPVVLPFEPIEVTVSSLETPGALVWKDAVAEKGWWQIYNGIADGKYEFSLSNSDLTITEAAGTYNAADLEPEYSYITVKSETDTVFFTSGFVTVAISQEGVVTVKGTLVGDDDNRYAFDLTYVDPVAEDTVDVTVSKGILDESYADAGYYAVGGLSNDSTIGVQLGIISDGLNGFQGDYTENNLDYGDYFNTSLVYLYKENRVEMIFSAAIHVTPGNGEGVYSITADLLCYNKVFYKVTMQIGNDTDAIDNTAVRQHRCCRQGCQGHLQRSGCHHP